MAKEEREVVGWITVKGVHVPLYEGEGRVEAVKRWTKQFTENNKTIKETDKNVKELKKNGYSNFRKGREKGTIKYERDDVTGSAKISRNGTIRLMVANKDGSQGVKDYDVNNLGAGMLWKRKK